jgi:DNA-binding beta-propeller fold protein YncE
MKGLLVLLFSFLLLSDSYGLDNLKIVWQTDSVFRHPESIVYDAEKSCFYVSNMDKNTPNEELYSDVISKVSKNGKKIHVEWMKGLSSPSGMVLKNDTLYVVERNGIALVDMKSRKIIKRIPIETKGFLNDITIDSKNRIFVTETETIGVIYIIENDTSQVWYKGQDIGKINGILADVNDLILGVNFDGYLKKINISTKEISNLEFLGEGNIDGIQKTLSGKYLVSHFLGNLYEISPTKDKIELMNTRNRNLFIADFVYVPELKQIIIPSLRTNHIFSIHYEE